MVAYSALVAESIPDFAPEVGWNDFMTRVFVWKQGQHVAAIGPTGSGKTTLALAILPKRKYKVVFATKPRDETLSALQRSENYKRMRTWQDVDADLVPRRLLWPDATKLDGARTQQREFTKALNAIYRQGKWCVYMDELWFMIHHLKLEFEVRTYLQQARALDISLFVTTQRPKFVPLEVYDQSSHLFFWRDNDRNNLDRISGIAWLDASMVKHTVATLRKYELLYINTETGDMWRTVPPAPNGEVTQ